MTIRTIEMTKIIFLVLTLLTSLSPVFAQDKLLTLDDIFSPDPAKRVAFGGAPARLSWAADGRSFKEVRAGKLMRVDPVTGDATMYFDSDRFAGALQTAAGISQAEATRIANSLTTNFNNTETAILVNHGNDLWWYGINSGELKRLTNNKDEEKEQDFSPDGKFVEMVELPRDKHPYFIACQFHPEYKSKPLDAHPLFTSFVKAAWENRLKSENLEHDVTSDKQVELPERASISSED